ncbi:hypothetical protein [Streptomyces sp. NPDC058735]|uniref:hypothetical protein n=1 Tax=unclassified Streptomyces TaxID=2593676 RepID=UPI0036B5EF25
MTRTHGRSVLAAASGLVSLAVLTTGCGDSGGEPRGTRTVTETTTGPAATTSRPDEDEGTGPVRTYPGAEVVTEAKGFTMLRTDDSVERVGDFYIRLLEDEGWDILSKYEGETSVHLLARKGDDGLTVQVSPAGSGTTISISYYGV